MILNLNELTLEQSKLKAKLKKNVVPTFVTSETLNTKEHESKSCI